MGLPSLTFSPPTACLPRSRNAALQLCTCPHTPPTTPPTTPTSTSLPPLSPPRLSLRLSLQPPPTPLPLPAPAGGHPRARTPPPPPPPSRHHPRRPPPSRSPCLPLGASLSQRHPLVPAACVLLCASLCASTRCRSWRFPGASPHGAILPPPLPRPGRLYRRFPWRSFRRTPRRTPRRSLGASLPAPLAAPRAPL